MSSAYFAKAGVLSRPGLTLLGVKRLVTGGFMAVVAHVVLPGVTKEQYDRVREAVGWLTEGPTGGISHLTWWEGGDCHNADAWESEQAFNTFGESRLGPGMAQAGVHVAPQVTFHPAHEVFVPQAVTLTT